MKCQNIKISERIPLGKEYRKDLSKIRKILNSAVTIRNGADYQIDKNLDTCHERKKHRNWTIGKARKFKMGENIIFIHTGGNIELFEWIFKIHRHPLGSNNTVEH